MTDQTTPTPPVVHGTTDDAVFVNRGVETHGVGMHGRPDPDAPRFDLDGDPVVYEAKAEPPAPVPVFIVPGSTSEQRAMRIIRTSLRDTESLMILGQNEARTRARIKIISAGAGDVAWVAGQEHLANPNDGWPIAVGATEEFFHETALWARRDAASTTNPLPIVIRIDYMIEQH